MDDDAGLALIREFSEDRWRAHHYLFRHRHRDESPAAHRDLVQHIHGPAARLNVEGFRGFGKTTLLEECAIIGALYGEFHNGVVVAASLPRAMDRLEAIRHEIEGNPLIAGIWGEQRFQVRQDVKVVLSNGVCIQALGRDQSMMGIKYRDWRPDFALIDDVEDPEERRTDVDRLGTWHWLIRTFLPSLDDQVGTPVRALGTRRGKNSLPERLEAAGWRTLKYPIEYRDEHGEPRATWPARFGLGKIAAIRADYRGDMHTWAQEYMCEAYSEADRVFSVAALRVEPRVRASYQPVYAMYDPARSTGASSATTGIAVWSWVRNRLVFWELRAEQWLPDQIIADLFRVDREFGPVWLGFEENGLNEWAKQPIRAEMMRRRVMLPLLPVNAPRGKDGFIMGLQPYVKAGEVEFAGVQSDFRVALEQFANFMPGRRGGRIDAPNAAAYALLLRPGAPVYDFPEDAVVEGLEAMEGVPLYLAANSDGAVVTAALVQRAEGEVRILADWIREGAPAEVAGEIHAEAALMAETARFEAKEEYDEAQPYKLPVSRRVSVRLPLRWVAPYRHTEVWNNVGLIQAIRAIPQSVSAAPERAEEPGRIELVRLLDHRHRGRYLLSVGAAATWSCRAFAGGYARSVDTRGVSAARPDGGLYRLLMEGIEAFAGVGAGAQEKVEDQQPMAYTRTGVPYKSAMPERGVRR
jgi:hypothetical protein